MKQKKRIALILALVMVFALAACGAINACLGLSDRETLEAAVLDSVPRGTEELNRRALAEGVALWETVKKSLTN